MPNYKRSKQRFPGFRRTHTLARGLRVGPSNALLLLALIYCLIAYQFAAGFTLSKQLRLALVFAGVSILSFFMLEVLPLSELSETASKTVDRWMN